MSYTHTSLFGFSRLLALHIRGMRILAASVISTHILCRLLQLKISPPTLPAFWDNLSYTYTLHIVCT